MMDKDRPGSQSDRELDNRFRSRARGTCIEHCANYVVLTGIAEAEQERINAARAAGKEVSGSYVKLICPYDPNLECPAFVHVPTVEGEPPTTSA